MKDPADTATLSLPYRRHYTSEPAWLFDAAASCPTEAQAMRRCTTDLQVLPHDVAMPVFIATYERMLDARDRLYAAWMATEGDSPLIDCGECPRSVGCSVRCMKAAGQ